MASEDIVLRDRTIRNTRTAAEAVRRRIHNGAGSSLGEVIDAHLTPTPDEGVFWNGFPRWPLAITQKNVPGFHYFKKFEAFIAKLYDIGIISLQSGSPCPFHQENCWIGPKVSKVT